MSPGPACQSAEAAVLYCASCQELLSTSSLLLSTHRRHQYLTLQEALRNQLENIKERFSKLESKVRRDAPPQVSRATQQLEDLFTETQDAINDQHKELQMLLEKNEKQAFNLLEAEKESLDRTLSELEKDGKEFEQKLEKMTKDVQQLTKRQIKKEKPRALLDEINSLELNIEVVGDFYSSVQEQKFDGARLRALEGSVKKIVQKNKDFLPRPWEFPETITFSESKKHKSLEVLKNGREVSLTVSSISRPKNQKAQWSSVVAVQSFRKDQHYWEVEVGSSQSWAVGVIEQGWEKKGGLGRPLGRDGKSWVLESDEGDLKAQHDNDLIAIRNCGTCRLGVFVDCNKGQVKFYNVSTGCILHSFSTRCKKQLYPAFSLKAKVNSTAQLRICRIKQDDAQDSLDELTSNSDEGSDSGFVNSGESTSSGDSTESGSFVESAEPGSSVESTEPESSVESAEPRASVESAEPRASVESAEPEASVESVESSEENE